MSRLNGIQRQLLDLVKEIDAIAVRHGIDYYLSGGSVIGALRHHGFIPWDDDIDILIDSRSWKKLQPFLVEEMPPNRSLGCLELEEGFPNNPIYHYCAKDTANIHKNEMLGDNVAGVLIDIIILDPFLGDEEEFKKHLTNICLYSDVANPYYSYSQRFDLPIPLEEYLDRAATLGRLTVLHELEAQLMKYDPETADSYVIRWGAGPNIFPIDYFGTPRRVPFEDICLPIPSRAEDFLCVVYGDEWYEVPEPDDRTSHETILDLDRSYEEYFAQYVDRIDREKISADFAFAKRHRHQHARQNSADSKALVNLRLLDELAVVERRLDESGVSAASLKEARDIQGTYEIYRDYLAYQGSSECLGGEMWDGLIRRFDPVFIDVGDGILSWLLCILIHRGQVYKAFRVLRARGIAVSRPLDDELVRIRDFIEEYRRANSQAFAGDYETALGTLERLSGGWLPIPVPALLKTRIELSRRIDGCISDEVAHFVVSGLSLVPDDGVFMKYRADIEFQKHGYGASFIPYLEACLNTRNGLVWLDVAESLRDDAEAGVGILGDLFEQGERERVLAYIDAWKNLGFDDVSLEVLRFKARYSMLREHPAGRLSQNPPYAAYARIEDEVFEEIERRGGECPELFALVSSLRTMQGMPSGYPHFDLRLRKALDFEGLDGLLHELQTLDDDAGRTGAWELEARILLRMGKTAEAFALLRPLAMGGESAYAREYLRTDLEKMIRAIEGAPTGEYRKAAIRELGVKYPSREEAISFAVELLSIPDGGHSAASGYLGRLFDGEIGRVGISPLLTNSGNSGEGSEAVMDRFQRAAFGLLEEVDDICRAHGIAYYLHYDVLGLAINGGFSEGGRFGSGIEMTAQDALKFMAAVEETGNPNRIVEHMGNSMAIPCLYLRYVDTSTLYLPVNSYYCQEYQSLAITIHIIRGKIEKRYTRRLLNALEMGGELHHPNARRHDDEDGQNAVKLAKAFSRMLGTARFRRMLFERLMKEHAYRGGDAWIRERFTKKRKVYPGKYLEQDPVSITIEGREFPVAFDAEAYMRKWRGVHWRDRVYGVAPSKTVLVDERIDYASYRDFAAGNGQDIESAVRGHAAMKVLFKEREGYRKDRIRLIAIAGNVKDNFDLADAYRMELPKLRELDEQGSIVELEEALGPYRALRAANAKLSNGEPTVPGEVVDMDARLKAMTGGEPLDWDEGLR